MVQGLRAAACGAGETGQRLGELVLPAEALAEARASQAQLEGLYPELFRLPYVSACRSFGG